MGVVVQTGGSWLQKAMKVTATGRFGQAQPSWLVSLAKVKPIMVYWGFFLLCTHLMLFSHPRNELPPRSTSFPPPVPRNGLILHPPPPFALAGGSILAFPRCEYPGPASSLPLPPKWFNLSLPSPRPCAEWFNPERPQVGHLRM